MSAEISQEWQDLTDKDDEYRANLLKQVQEIVPYLMGHNAEAEACDLLMEIEKLDLVEKHVDESTYSRVCLYLSR